MPEQNSQFDNAMLQAGLTIPASLNSSGLKSPTTPKAIDPEQALQNAMNEVTNTRQAFNLGTTQQISPTEIDTSGRFPLQPYGADLETLYNQNQSWASNLANGVANALVKIPTGIMSGAGFFLGLMNMGNNSDKYGEGPGAYFAGATDNFLVRWAGNIEDATQRFAPVYHDTADRDEGLIYRATHDESFWSEDTLGAVSFLISAALTGGAAAELNVGSKLFNGLNKMSKLARTLGAGAAEIGEEAGLAGKAFTGALEATSAGATEAGQIGEAAQLFSRIPNQKLINMTDKFVVNTINSASEAMFEVKDFKDQIRSTLDSDPRFAHLSEEEKNAISARQLPEVFGANLALLSFTNMFETDLIMKKAPSTASALAERAVKDGAFGNIAYKTAWKDYRGDLGKALFEGFWKESLIEENAQLAIQRFNQEQALSNRQKGAWYINALKQAAGITQQTLEQTGAALTGNDPEAAISMAIGTIIGGLGGGFGTYSQYKRDNAAIEAQKKDEHNISNSTDIFTKFMKMHQTEEYTKPDGTKGTRAVLDDEGNPVPDYDAQASYIANQSKILELNDLMNLNDAQRKTFMRDIYEGELFSRFALSHFKAGLGEQLLAKLDNVGQLSEADLEIMGYDVNSRDKAAPKIAQFKEQALQLQKLYDDVQQNIVEPAVYLPRGKKKTRTDALAFQNRKDEIFRLGARQFNLDNLISKANTQITSANAYMSSMSPSSTTDATITELNQLYANLKSATVDLDSAEFDAHAKAQLNKLPTDEEPLIIDDETLKEVRQNYKDAQKAFADAQEKYKEIVPTLSRNDEGFYKYSADKEKLVQTKNLRIAQLKRGELEMSRNSVIERLSKLADNEKGQKFYDDYVNQIAESKKPTFITSKESAIGKTTEQYETYEEKRLRSKRITGTYEDIIRDFNAEVATSGLADADLTGLKDIVNNIRNMGVSLDKATRDKVLDAVNTTVQDTTNQINNRIAEIEDTIKNTKTDVYDEEFDEYYTDENAVAMVQDLVKEKAQLQTQLTELADFPNLAASIGEYTPTSKTPESIRRQIAEEHMVEGEKIVKDLDQAKQGYDSIADLENVQNEIKELEALKNIFEQRVPLTSTKDFTGFMDKLNDTLAKLREAEKEISRRVSDRMAKDKKVLKNNVILYGYQFGVDFNNKTTTSTFNDIVTTINQVMPDKALLINSKIGDWLNETDDIVRLGIIGGISDLYKAAYNQLDEQAQETTTDELKSKLERVLNDIKNNPVMQEAIRATPNVVELYEKSPGTIFSGIVVNTGLKKNKSLYDDMKGSVLNQFRENRDILEYLENAKKDKREGAPFTPEEVASLIELHIQYSSLNDLINDTSIDTLSYNENIRELEVQKTTTLTPSQQQLKALRELVVFFNTPSSNEFYAPFAYIKGAAGTGKSTIVGQWLPQLVNVTKEEVYAVGHNFSSSKNINEVLGKPTTQFNQLLDALGTNTKMRLIIVDEIGGFTTEQLDELANKVQIYNENKTPENQAKVVLMGDPNQINIGSGNRIQLNPDVELVHTSDPVIEKGALLEGNNLINNIKYITPLTIRFRSNVSQISNFSDKFINQNKDLSQEEIIVKSNNPKLDPTITEKENVTGVVGTKDFRGDVVKHLKATDTTDGRSRAVITNPENVIPLQEHLKANGINNVEVLSYIDAQGRTIDEVYISIKKDDALKDQNLYNKALYVATSRATNFILMDGMNIRNEQDSGIVQDKEAAAKQIEDTKKEFTENREKERDTIKNIIGDTVVKKAEARAEAQKENTEKREAEEAGEEVPSETVEEGLAETIHDAFDSEVVEDDEVELEDGEQLFSGEAVPQEFSDEQVEEQIEEGNLSREDLDAKEAESVVNRTDTFSNKTPDPDTEFVHNLKFPSFGATKNLVIDANGNEVLMSDEQLKKRKNKKKENITVLNSSIKEGDTAYYAPVDDINTGQIYFVVLSPERRDDGGIEKDTYREVAVIGEEELKQLNNDQQRDLYNQLMAVKNDPETKTVEVDRTSKRGLKVYDVEKRSKVKGEIRNATHLKFDYNSKQYNKFSLKKIIDDFVEGFFPKALHDTKKAEVRRDAYIKIYTDKDLLASNPDGLLAGVPYLILPNLETVSGRGKAKQLFIRLDRRQLHKTDHADYIQPVLDFIGKVKEWDKRVPAKYAFGTKEGNNLIKTINLEKNPGEALSKLVSDTDPNNLAALALDIRRMVLRPGERGDFKKGVSVVFTDDVGDPVRGKIASVFTPENEEPQAEIMTSDGEKITMLVSDLKLAQEAPGSAQRVLNQLWSANRNAMRKLGLDKGRKIVKKNIFLAPGLLTEEKNIYNTQELDGLFSFDESGMHRFQAGETSLSFRIPVPMQGTRKSDDLVFNFKQKDNNGIGPTTTITDYYLQSNFESVQQTMISVVHGKTAKAQPTPKPAESTVDNTIAADYLLTGSIGTLLSTDYLLKGIAGVFTKAEKQIDNIRNKYAQELADKNLVDIKKFVNTEVYDRIISEIRDALDNAYKNSEIQNIFDEVLKYPTGMPNRIGNQIESRIEAIQEEVPPIQQEESEDWENEGTVVPENIVTPPPFTPDVVEDEGNITDDDLDDFFALSEEETPTGKVYTAEDLGKALTQDEVLNLVKKMFPKFKASDLKDRVKFVGEAEMMALNMGKPAWGAFYKNVIYLRENPDKTVYNKVVMHEVFHMIYNNYLTEQERKRFEDIVKRDNPKTLFLDREDFLEYVDEYGAELYMETKFPTGISAYIKMIINKIKNFFNFVSPNIESVNDLFNAINSGWITSRFGSEEDRVKRYVDSSISDGTINVNCV